jgi:hypothetical protein
MSRTLFAVFLLTLGAHARTVLTDMHYATRPRIIPARWTPRVSAATINEALGGRYKYSHKRDAEASALITELRTFSDYLKEVCNLHGDGLVGALLTQTRIKKAIEGLSRQRLRPEHDNAEVDEAAAETYAGLW